MNSKWPIVKINDIKANTKNAITIGPFGSRMKSECYVESGIPVIRGTNIGPTPCFINEFVYITEEKANELTSCNVYQGDLVFPHRGSIGEVGIIEKEQRYVLSSSLMKLTCASDKACPKFIYYFFKSQKGKHELLKNASQVGTPGIGQPLSSLKSIELPLPPLKTQEKIARILGDLDKQIQLNQQINQTLERIVQSLFKSWFVDFEPVKIKMAILGAGGGKEDATISAMTAISGKQPDELAIFKSEHPESYAELKMIAELFPSSMQDNDSGKVPSGWTLSEIGNEVDVVGGSTPSTKIPQFWDNGDINWTTPKDLSDLKDKILIKTERKITKDGLNKISSGLLPVNTVLMSSRAPVGYLALAKIPVAINQGYIAMKCDYDLSPEFILQWCSANMPEIISRASGTTFAEISKKNFNQIPLIKPSMKLVEYYTKQAGNIYSLIEKNSIINNELTEIRDTLSPKFFSGEIPFDGDR
ncbi:restriction endonuclease subunit S [Escherichia coli]